MQILDYTEDHLRYRKKLRAFLEKEVTPHVDRIEAGKHLQRGSLKTNPAQETIEVRFPQPIPAGRAKLELAFAGQRQIH